MVFDKKISNPGPTNDSIVKIITGLDPCDIGTMPTKYGQWESTNLGVIFQPLFTTKCALSSGV
jgi:hypothetical protein